MSSLTALYARSLKEDHTVLRISAASAPRFHSFRRTIGLDFAGPVYFRNMYSNKSRVFKAFIAIFTRASPRMVHLELGPDRSTETPLECLWCSISGGELPPMISDSGKTFRGSSSKAFLF
ncbi:hypothetical protein pdam_00007945 [Pocillopora damicornis]|uniref:Integrase catalytic domain-containing protein n=1 Tax=Pocillopora damicornis TaxID=46731 RepID=A0A3M6UF20_POCDA|nr:hypothetical protein pdam_00007945 [Pocillopora damicornis]